MSNMLAESTPAEAPRPNEIYTPVHISLAAETSKRQFPSRVCPRWPLKTHRPLSFGRPGGMRNLAGRSSENPGARFRIDDRQILDSHGANVLQRVRAAMVFTPGQCLGMAAVGG